MGTGIDDRGREFISYKVLDKDGDDDTSVRNMVNIDDIESVLNLLTDDQRVALESLETGLDLSLDEMKAALSSVPGLSDDQIQSLLELELSLSKNEELLQKLGKLEG